MIRLEGVTFRYPALYRGDAGSERAVLSQLSLHVRQGERVALCGPNGSGKTTVMRIVMGLLRATQGTVEVLGAERRTEDDFRQIRGPVGYLFQDSDDQLFCPTVEEDVAFGPLNQGLSHAEAMQEVQRVLQELEIGHLRQSIAHRLSGGEKKLVALAGILAMRPKCLLLDEPAAGLDAHAEGVLERYLLTRVDTALITSHDRGFLARVTAREVTL